MEILTERVDFEGSQGGTLSASLDMPFGKPRAFAIFAHCFTCSKNFNATRRISGALARQGIAVLRFDFTGLGSSQGDFASTNFSSNVSDLIVAAGFLRENYQAPSLLIGHSLGGAAVLVAASEIKEVGAVVTVGAPSDANHVTHNFAADLEKISADGKADVNLGGRKFTIEKQFLDDLANSTVEQQTANLKKPLLVMHSPIDQTVGIENAQNIFIAAKHPKSFISLDNADHLLTKEADAIYVAQTIASWASKYLPEMKEDEAQLSQVGVCVVETGNSKFQNDVYARSHHLLADEPKSFGGTDTGPTPYDFLGIALGACTNMTLRMYTERKGWDIGKVSVSIEHDKIHAADCETCDEASKSAGGKIDQFHRKISFTSDIKPEMHEKLLEIADKCPVHKTLHAVSNVTTEIV